MIIEDFELRPFRPGDAAAFHEAVSASVDELRPWMPWCHPDYTLDEATAWVTMQSKAFSERSEFEFAIIGRSNQVLGACGLNQIDVRNRRANVGYWIRSSASGQGLAAAAVARLLLWAEANTDFQRFEIVVATENVGSLRVAEKVGAVREGTLRQRLLLHDHFHDAVIFSLVRGVNLVSAVGVIPAL